VIRDGLRRASLTAGGWFVMGGSAAACIATVLPAWRLARAWDPDRAVPHRVANLAWGRVGFRVAPWWTVTVRGRERLPAGGAYLLCPNHQSFMDVPALHALGAPFKWVMDRRFFRVPGFAAWLRAAGYVGVDATDPVSVRAALDEVERWLRRGMPVALFPEGTRSRDGRLGRFRRGPFRVAHETGVPVVPVVIRGTRAILPPDRLSYETPPPWRVEVEVLPPVRAGAHEKPAAMSRATRERLLEALGPDAT